jgi:putative ABC transport system ATP-binding protein
MSLIEVSELKFRYKTNAEVLNIPKFSIEKGETVFLFGPSGSGKTTLLEILAGVLTPNAGHLKFLDQDWTALSSQERDRKRAIHIGYIFQSFNLIPYLSVYENIELPLHLSPERKAKVSDSKREILRLCQNLGIESLLNNPVTELSVGQQQRVAVARALLGAPDLILADEPTSALDYDHREKFIKLLFQQAQEQGSTVVFVSHDRTIENLFSRKISLVEINKAKSFNNLSGAV